MQILPFRVADAQFRIIFNDTDDARPLLPSYAPFYVKDANAQADIFTLTVAQGLCSFEAEGQEVGQFDCGGINHGVYRRDEGGYKILISNLEQGAACAITTNADFSVCQASVFGNEDSQRFGLNNAIMIAFSFAGAHHDIVLMHSSVTLFQDHGYLFLGKSGTGKSTHSALWRKHIAGADLLNDDNPAVRAFPDGRVIVYGTPWSGKTPCYRNMSVPVGAFLRLEQHPENIISKDGKLQTFATVLSSCSTMIWDKPSYDGILATINRIAATVPSFYLKCRADEEAARLSQQTIVAND